MDPGQFMLPFNSDRLEIYVYNKNRKPDTIAARGILFIKTKNY